MPSATSYPKYSYSDLKAMSYAYALMYKQKDSSGPSGDNDKSSDAESSDAESSDTESSDAEHQDRIDFLRKEKWKMKLPRDENSGEKRIPPAVENALTDQLDTLRLRADHEPRETTPEREDTTKGGRRVKLLKDGELVRVFISLTAATRFICTREGLQLTDTQIKHKVCKAGQKLTHKSGSMTYLKYQWTYVDAKIEGEQGYEGESLRSGKHTKVCRKDTKEVRTYPQLLASCRGVVEVITKKPHEKVFAEDEALQKFLLKFPENSKREKVLYDRVRKGLRAEHTNGGLSEHSLFGFTWTLFQP